MAYTIYNNNGTILLNLADGEVDDVTTSLDLIGKNVNNYGEILNNNLVRLLTNFSSVTAPRSPQVGQLWFNPNDGILRVWKGDAFKNVYDSAATSSAPVNPSNGDYWFDTINSQLKVYIAEKGWTIVGPNLPTQWGRFGVEPPHTTSAIHSNSIIDDGNNNRSVPGYGAYASVVYNWSTPSAILSKESFQLSTASYDYYTKLSNNSISTSSNTLVEGVNVLRNLKVFNNSYFEGNLYLKGDLLLSPNKNLSSQFNIRNFGNPLDLGVSTATRVQYLNTSNIAIRNNLKLLFPTETTSTFDTYGYPLGSEVRVLCEYTTLTSLTESITDYSVRRYMIKDIAGVKVWDPVNIYYNVLLQTFTNIVVNPNPPILINPRWALVNNLSTTVTSISTASTNISFTTSATLIWDFTDGAAMEIRLQRPQSLITSTGYISTTSYIVNFTSEIAGRYTATVISYALTGAVTSETRVLSVYNMPIVLESTWAGLSASTNTIVTFNYNVKYASQVEVSIKNSAGRTVTSSSIFYNAFSNGVSSGIVTATFTLTGISTATLTAINPAAITSSTIKTITIVP
jgi:hypothetical protein